ncbi:peptidoglycan meso-diaminopimelic acid protein amidase [Edwardsiella tarda]|uniref:peptidoglycan meso-diaminopimelic acid protein amidase n=1 Tax=Edwardsiella tarda TaxID=636 RepID=UPI00351C2DB0
MSKIVTLLAICLALPLAACKSSASESGSVPRSGVNSLLGSLVYIQIFKEERQLELYAKVQNGYQLVKRFPICKFSGGLGPKRTEGDFKSPEGFYQIDARHLKPDSRYYQAINIGYPNPYDQAHGYSGKYLMIHGDCVSVGCYAMTNAGISEIYRYVQSAFRNGQMLVDINIYPFHMTERNMQRHRNSSYINFWRELQPGYQYFAQHALPPQVNVQDGRYVVNAPLPAGSAPSRLAFAQAE